MARDLVEGVDYLVDTVETIKEGGPSREDNIKYYLSCLIAVVDDVKYQLIKASFTLGEAPSLKEALGEAIKGIGEAQRLLEYAKMETSDE